MTDTTVTPKRLIKIKEVVRNTGLSATEIYRRIAGGQFPSPIKIGTRASAWIESEVQAWIEQAIAEAREG